MTVDTIDAAFKSEPGVPVWRLPGVRDRALQSSLRMRVAFSTHHSRAPNRSCPGGQLDSDPNALTCSWHAARPAAARAYHPETRY